MYAEVAKVCGKNESSICETVKQGRETHADLAVTPQPAKVKMEKALHLWADNTNRKSVWCYPRLQASAGRLVL